VILCWLKRNNRYNKPGLPSATGHYALLSSSAASVAKWETNCRHATMRAIGLLSGSQFAAPSKALAFAAGWDAVLLRGASGRVERALQHWALLISHGMLRAAVCILAIRRLCFGSSAVRLLAAAARKRI
jgi:hypothetical protein